MTDVTIDSTTIYVTVDATTFDVAVAVPGPQGPPGKGGGEGGASALIDLTDVTGTPGTGKAPVSDGAGHFPLTDVATQTELNAEASARASADTAAIASAEGYADAAIAGLSAVYQPLDSDLTAIAALTTTSFGRSLLALADASALRTAAALGTAATANTGDFDAAGAAAAAQAASQPLDSDLTAIAALTTTTFGRALLALADAAAGRTALGLGTLATQSGTFSGTSSGTNTGDQTSVTGNAGTATALQTGRTIDGQTFDGTANVTVIAPGTHAATSKATPVDADELSLVDSAASNVLKKLTWANLKATLKTYFDTLYQPTGNSLPKVPSGLYTQLSTDANGVRTLTLNREEVVGFLVGPQTIAELAVQVGTAGDASAVVRIGVRVDSNGVPGNVGVQGTVVATSTGWKSLAVNYIHPGGILWVSITGQGWSATAVILKIATSFGAGGYPVVGAAALSTLGWSAGHGPVVGFQTGVSGALGSTFTNTNSTNLSPALLAAKGA